MSQIFGIFRNRNIAKITVPLDSARFFALRPLQYMDFFTFLQVIFLRPQFSTSSYYYITPPALYHALFHADICAIRQSAPMTHRAFPQTNSPTH